MLWLAATPIGNLGDASPRLREALASADAIAAEDTRHTSQLLRLLGIDQRPELIALHDHNERDRAAAIVDRAEREEVVLVSDAGMPTVSDPGFRVVQLAAERGVAVSAIPGPSAVITALAVAGLPTDRFAFEGFLPAKASARRERLRALAAEPRTLLFYESSHRIAETLADMVQAFGDERPAVLARELTKLFETVLDGSLAQLQVRVEADEDQRKGEFVVLVQGAGEDADAKVIEGRRLYAKLKDHLPPSTAAKLAAELSGAPRKALYGSD